MNDRSEGIVVKGVATVAAIAAAWLANKAIAAAWRATLGHDIPTDGDEDNAPLGELLAAAAITGAVVALVRALATRQGTRVAQRAIASKGR